MMENINDYWIVVISSEEDGLIRFFGRRDEDYRFHLQVLKDYLYTYYNDLAKKVGADDLRDNNDLLIYLTTLGNIVYQHSPGYGLLFLPKEVSEKQVESLYGLFRSFEKMPIHIDYHLVRKRGRVVPQEIMDYQDGLENTEMLDRFFKTKPYVKKRVK